MYNRLKQNTQSCMMRPCWASTYIDGINFQYSLVAEGRWANLLQESCKL